MPYCNHQHPGQALQLRRLPWFMFLFLAAVFFFVHHDLFYSTTVIDNYLPSVDELTAGVTEGLLTRRVALLSLGFVAIVSLVRHRANGRLRINGPLGWILLSFAAWALVSPIWAEDLALTLRRLVVFGILCIAAVAVARRLSLRELILWTFFSTGFFLVIGVCAEMLLGTFRPFSSGYRFAGTLHPNVQGVNCALVLLSAVAAADVDRHRRTIFRACALLGFLFLILTGSRTAFAAALLALAVYLSAVCSRATKIAVASALIIIVCLLLLVLGNAFLPDLKNAAMLGRDGSTVASFDGRNGIWEECAYYVARRPITGYGFGGFWNENHIADISAENKWGVSGAHSAYLDCFLQVGLVGLVAYILALFVGIGRAFRLHILSQNPTFAFSGVLLLFCVMDGLLESVVITPTFLMFLCMVAVTQLAFATSPGKREGSFIQTDTSIFAPRARP